MPVYVIMGGVRRAVAALRAGRQDIPAVIHNPGQPAVVTRVALADLLSSKDMVFRDWRYMTRTEYPTAVLGTEPPPIEVQPLGVPGQSRKLTPLAQVRLV
jgi:hypothetical protein